MAEPINIQIDPDHLRAQVKRVIDDELRVFSSKLRHAADALDPEFVEYQDKWIESQVEARLSKRLKETEK